MIKYKTIIYICMISAIIFYALPATAVLYKYTDSKGITHFTDNLKTVPAKYKSRVEQEKPAATPVKKEEPPASEFSSAQAAPVAEVSTPSGGKKAETPIIVPYMKTPDNNEFNQSPYHGSQEIPEGELNIGKPAPVSKPIEETRITDTQGKAEKAAASAAVEPVKEAPAPELKETAKKEAVAETKIEVKEIPVAQPKDIPKKEPAGVVVEPVKEAPAPELKETAKKETVAETKIEVKEVKETPVAQPKDIPKKEPASVSDKPIQEVSATNAGKSIPSAPSSLGSRDKPEPMRHPTEQPHAKIEKKEPEPKAIERSAPTIPDKAVVPDTAVASLTEKRNILAGKKSELNKKLDALLKEKQDLDAIKDSLTGQGSIDKYNQDVKLLNAKIKQFKNEEQSLREEIEAYNNSIK